MISNLIRQLDFLLKQNSSYFKTELTEFKSIISNDASNEEKESKAKSIATKAVEKINNDYKVLYDEYKVVTEYVEQNKWLEKIMPDSYKRDFISKTTDRYKRAFEEFISEEMFNYFKPKIGLFWQEIDIWIEAATKEDTHENEGSSRKGNTQKKYLFEEDKQRASYNDIKLVLRKDVEASFLTFCEAKLSAFSTKILSEGENLLKILVAEIDADKDKKNINYEVALSTNLLNFYNQKNERIIESVVRIDKPYEGRYPKTNYKNLLMEVRGYSIMLILILSTLRINTNANDDIAFIFYTAIFMLIAWGVVDTYFKTKSGKQEQFLKETQNVVEKLNSDFKRIANDYSMEVKGLLSKWFETTLLQITTCYADVLYEFFEQKKLEFTNLNAQRNTLIKDLNDLTKAKDSLINLM